MMSAKSILIASSGRTGTTYIQDVLSSCFVNLYQEPDLSRFIYMLSNFADAQQSHAASSIIENVAVELYNRGVHARYNRQPNTAYVEINPFVSNILPQFAQSNGFRYDAMVHIVRKPSSWVKSMIQFGAYSWRKPIIRRIPFAFHRDKSVKNWSTLTFAQKLGHEWVHRNNRINESKKYFPVHFTVKYEDIFFEDKVDFQPLMPVFDDLGLPTALIASMLPAGRSNSSIPEQNNFSMTQADTQYIRMLTAHLEECFGYETA